MRPGSDRRSVGGRAARWIRAAAVWAVVAVTGCGGEPPALTVGPVAFSEEVLGALGPAQQDLLVDLTALGLVVAEGRTDELIRPHVERDLRSIVLQRAALELAADQAGVGDDALRRYYRRNPRYELVVRHLVILSERWRPAEHRDSARAAARAARDRAVAGEPFEALAAEYSDEPGAADRGGRLEPGRRGSWVPEFWEAAAALEEGEISPVVETEFGFHVIRLEERRPVPFEEVRDTVLNDVMDLPSALGRAGSWADRRMRLLRLDSVALRRWAADSAVSGPMARWPDTLGIPPLTADALTRYRASSGSAGQEPVQGVEGAIELARSAAQTHMMLHKADELGIEPSASQRMAIRDRWRERIARWAGALGFEAGDPPEVVREKALQALGAQEQSAAIARSEIETVSRRLREIFPVRRPASGEE